MNTVRLQQLSFFAGGQTVQEGDCEGHKATITGLPMDAELEASSAYHCLD